MKQLLHLLKHDFILLRRNNIILISIVVTALYTAIFRAMSTFGNIEKAMVLVIFNDPALLGFLFAGVMVLFEKNENTLQALAVSPMKISNYILSKSIALTFISLVCCLAMAIAGNGFTFNVYHYITASILSTLLFSFLGFIVVAGQSSFNHYILRAIGVVLFLSVPFLGYFEIIPRYWFLLFPTQPVIDLFSLSFTNTLSTGNTIFAYSGSLIWCCITYLWAKKAIVRNFK